MDAKEDTSALLVLETDVSAFEGLIPRPLEPKGAPSFLFFPEYGANLMATTEVLNMVKLVNKASQCLKLLTRITEERQWSCFAMTGPLEKSSLSGEAPSKLQGIIERLELLHGVCRGRIHRCLEKHWWHKIHHLKSHTCSGQAETGLANERLRWLCYGMCMLILSKILSTSTVSGRTSPVIAQVLGSKTELKRSGGPWKNEWRSIKELILIFLSFSWCRFFLLLYLSESLILWGHFLFFINRSIFILHPLSHMPFLHVLMEVSFDERLILYYLFQNN